MTLTARSSLSDVLLNVDLLSVATSYWSYSSEWLPFFGQSDDKSLLSHVIYRYEHIWLPLVATVGLQSVLEPPPDVHWIWHIHLLRPDHYSEYCKERFGRILPHRLIVNQEARASGRERAAAHWGVLSQTPFLLDLTITRLPEQLSKRNTQLDFLHEAAVQESEFFYQISLPHYHDQKFIYEAVERYRKLIQLFRSTDERQFVVPVDIQFIHRLHLLHPVQYEDDILRALGTIKLWENSPSFLQTSRSGDETLKKQSSELWKNSYSLELFIRGTCYRGRALNGFVKKFPNESFTVRTVDSCEFSISNICVDGLWTADKNIVVEGRLLGENSYATTQLFSAKGCPGKSLDIRIIGDSQNSSESILHFDAKTNRGIELTVYLLKGFFFFSHRSLVSTKLFSPLQYLNKSTNRIQKVTLPKISYTDPQISFNLIIDSAKPHPFNFTMDRNEFEVEHIPPDLCQVIEGLPNWMKAMRGEKVESFHRARHSLKCREGGICFGVEIVKHEDLALGAVLLYHNNQTLVACAYSIDLEQLPQLSQVQETCSTGIDSGDWAFVIRNHSGDFAVCVARWNFLNGNTDTAMLTCMTYLCQSGATEIHEISSVDIHKLKVGSVTVDLPSGKFTIDSSCDDLVEHITWAFSVGLMYVMMHNMNSLCSLEYPTSGFDTVRSEHWQGSFGHSTVKSTRSQGRSVSRKKLSRQRKRSASFTFLLACGLQIDLALYGAESLSLRSYIQSTTSSLQFSTNGGNAVERAENNSINQAKRSQKIQLAACEQKKSELNQSEESHPVESELVVNRKQTAAVIITESIKL